MPCLTLSRRTLVTSAAALPALAVPAVAVALPVEPDQALSRLADQICAEHDRIGTLGRDIDPSDRELYNSLDAELWETPATSINDLAAKARVLDQNLRTDGIAHSENDKVWDLIDELLAMAVQS